MWASLFEDASFRTAFFLEEVPHNPLSFLIIAMQYNVKNENPKIPTKIPNTNENWWLVEKS